MKWVEILIHLIANGTERHALRTLRHSTAEFQTRNSINYLTKWLQLKLFAVSKLLSHSSPLGTRQTQWTEHNCINFLLAFGPHHFIPDSTAYTLKAIQNSPGEKKTPSTKRIWAPTGCLLSCYTYGAFTFELPSERVRCIHYTISELININVTEFHYDNFRFSPVYTQ